MEIIKQEKWDGMDGRKKFFDSGCPDCGCDKFLSGPRGGMCINFKCEQCGSEFNDMFVAGIERINEAGEVN